MTGPRQAGTRNLTHNPRAMEPSTLIITAQLVLNKLIYFRYESSGTEHVGDIAITMHHVQQGLECTARTGEAYFETISLFYKLPRPESNTNNLINLNCARNRRAPGSVESKLLWDKWSAASSSPAGLCNLVGNLYNGLFYRGKNSPIN